MRNFIIITIVIVSAFMAGCKKSDSSTDSGNGNQTDDVRVTTYTPQDITANSAVCGGDAIVTQGLSLTEIGVCWNTEENPEANDNHVSTEVWNEPFVCTITGLEQETKYYVRAYALRGLEYYYGETKSFTTEQILDDLVYNDENPIHLALREEHKIADSSAYPITYSTSDDMYVTVSDDGVLFGKNVGSAQVTLDNGYHSLTIDVIVDLFREPTFEFGCNTNRIEEIYGEPYSSYYINDSLTISRYTSNSGYSYACWEMQFLFWQESYTQANVYIKQDFDLLLSNYLENNFDLITITNENSYVFRSKIDNSIICEKRLNANQYDDVLLMYYKDYGNQTMFGPEKTSDFIDQ